jgi:hypothetical protein
MGHANFTHLTFVLMEICRVLARKPLRDVQNLT